jgi:16S rRNA (cytidine1402-2'-O)-methyltransferase
MPGTLYLVATPIGNLQDITLRAIETLRSVNVIACEDTRHTRNLLTHLRISNKLVSYHEHNEYERAEQLADRLLLGESIAVVSDAGTPGISDPGLRLVRRAVEIGATVIPVPGPVAFVSAGVASGLATDSIFFGGFLPSKKGERRRRLEEIKDIPATLVFYEAPHRLVKSLTDCLEILGDRHAAVGRELTKIHEEIIRGTLAELFEQFNGQRVKGEIVIVIEWATAPAGSPKKPKASITVRIAELEKDGLEPKAALKKAAKEFGISKSEAYRLAKIK